jgi:DNA repair ATPase RecN
LTKQQLELLDNYFEHKRWFRAKTKALFRDWEREKLELKQKTVKMIEQEVQETRVKL